MLIHLTNAHDVGELALIKSLLDGDGLRREEWIFEDWESAAVVKHRYLYFEEGILVGGWYEGSGVRRLPDFPVDKPHPKLQP